MQIVFDWDKLHMKCQSLFSEIICVKNVPAYDNLKYFFIVFHRKQIDISYKSSP